jgi:hypothetical protein
MDAGEQFEQILEAAERLGLTVRFEPLGGDGGGLARLRGRDVLFVDTLADTATRLERSLEALARLPGIDEHYLRPDLREHIDRIRNQGRT